MACGLILICSVSKIFFNNILRSLTLILIYIKLIPILNTVTSKLRACVSLFLLYVLKKRSCVAVSKWCISDKSIESIAKASIHRFETATEFNYVRPARPDCIGTGGSGPVA